MNARMLGIIACVMTLLVTTDPLADEEPGVMEPVPSEGTPGDFTFAAVVRRAAELAADAYEPDRPALPDYLADLDYDKYRDIRFDSDQTIWRKDGLPFQMQMFPRGFMFKDRVTIHIVDAGQVRDVPFRHDFFNYGKNQVPEEMPADLGFAGLRLMYPINRDDVFDEVMVFLGASYFRAVGKDLNYGITTRGLAIDTGLRTQEEFPVFREFWILKPDKDATEITLYALLDSESVTGAYRFRVKPGIETLIDVKSHLYLRKAVERFGIAPLTSMFFHGEDTDRFIDDFRPEVHDSDGLLVENGNGERIWRPLVNPIGLRVSNFVTAHPKSFGLFQRDRDFRSYEDLESHYQNRPSALVEPNGDWGEGSIELIEIPSNAERYDNIVAYWVPKRQTEAGQEWTLEYRLRFGRDLEDGMLGGRVMATRIGAAGTDVLDPSRRKFVIDFIGSTLAKLDPETSVEAVVTSTSGELSQPVAQANPQTQGWRLFFELQPDGDKPADLRAFLRHGDDVLSETWSFRWVRE